MKKSLHILFFGSLISAVNTVAQPTITATGINPIGGDVITTTNTNYVGPGSAGINQTWDLSTMTPSGASATFAYANPSSTPYASSFTNSNVSASYGGSYVYYKTSSAAWQFYGAVTSATMSYSNPEDFLHFPFTYTNTYTDSWATTFISGGYTFYRTGTTTVTADGYGTLITPSGTFSNVLRVHFIKTTRMHTPLEVHLLPYITRTMSICGI